MKIFNLLSIAFLLGGAPIIEVSGIGPSAFTSLMMSEITKTIELRESQETKAYTEQSDLREASITTISLD